MGEPAKKETAKVHILTIGLEAQTEATLKNVVAQCQVTTLPLDLEKLMEPVDFAPDLVIVGPPAEGVSLVEVAQLLRMQYSSCPILYTTHHRPGFERKIYQKNGFSDAFLLPIDGLLLARTMQDHFAKVTNGEIKSYRPVKLLDIQPGTTLDFDTTIYLPVNKKYIQYSAAGDPLDSERVEKLQKHKMKSVYVSAEQMPQFYQYSANRLKDLSTSNTISETERRERLETSVRDMLSTIFTDSSKDATFETGQGVAKDCQEIVKAFVLSSGGSNWYDRILSTLGDTNKGGYSHSANVSTFAALFSLGLGIGKPEELALAGLLHDVGMVDLPLEIQQKKESDMSPQEKALFHEHPEKSINILKGRKVVIPEKVQKAILQHHELYNGTGFPNGFMADRICKEAQLLTLADHFDELTTPDQNGKAMTPFEAVEFLRKQVTGNPSQMIFDPELLKQLLKLFPESGTK